MEKKLKDVLPIEFQDGSYDNSQAFKFKDVEINEEFFAYKNDKEFRQWPGKTKNVYYWCILKNGYAVGWNENPSRGWSFPIIKIR
jgi:hypothetical protein